VLSHPLLPKLKELRLSGMVDTLEERAELAREQKLFPVEFLALMIDDEIERRRQKKQSRMERTAGFENLKLLSGFDFAATPTWTGRWCWIWRHAVSSADMRTG